MRKIALTIILLFFAVSASATWHSDVVSVSDTGGYSSVSSGVPGNADGNAQYGVHGHCGHVLSHFMALPLGAGVSTNSNGILWSMPTYFPPHHLPLESHYQPPRRRLS